jgi:Xaa-Pro aminopeptidase
MSNAKSNSSGRLQKLREMVNEESAPILITQQKNLSWLIGGRSHVNIASEPGCCFFLVTEDKCILIVNNIEEKRLEEEEIQPGIWAETDKVEVWQWHSPANRERLVRSYLREGGMYKTDVDLEAKFLALRSVLDEDQIVEMRQIGNLTSEAIEQAALDIERGDSEYTIAGRLAYRCYERGLDPIVNLIAADERAYSRRHPLPTGNPVQSHAMLVVCARRNGLIASATRLVHFGPVPEELARKFQAVVEIDTRLIHATTAGKPLCDIFAEMKAFYRDAGYPDEYLLHHQGGLTGYGTRERLAHPGETLQVRAGQLYAWNPSIAGVKSEDTILVHSQSNEVITPTVMFPRLELNIEGTTYIRPGILQK